MNQRRRKRKPGTKKTCKGEGGDTACARSGPHLKLRDVVCGIGGEKKTRMHSDVGGSTLPKKKQDGPKTTSSQQTRGWSGREKEVGQGWDGVGQVVPHKPCKKNNRGAGKDGESAVDKG